MPSLSDFSRNDYADLFASKLKDAGTAAATVGLIADPNFRTILVGLGGTGVRTINHVKSEMAKRFQPGWNQSIAFLAVDASYSELDNAQSLLPNEKLCINISGINDRVKNPQHYPAAIRPFMKDGENANTAPTIGTNIDSDGCGRMRLIGKIKIHDKQDAMGADEMIVAKLSSVVASLQLPAGGSGFYDVYVICSGSGGTGSGGFLEMPSLIRKAMGNTQVHVNGIYYMPDAITGMDPTNAHKLKANGYATLKELNYYQGMQNRTGYDEVWSYGDPAEPELRGSKCFDVPYLVGCPGQATADAFDVTSDTIAEFLISMTVKSERVPGTDPFVTTAFYSNAMARLNVRSTNPGNPKLEAAGTSHEFPRSFATIGFASASMPKKLIRAYVVHEYCERAGLKPVSAEEYAKLTAGADGVNRLIPFKGENDLPNGVAGSNEARQIFAPILAVRQKVFTNTFSYIADLHLNPEDVKWNAIHDGRYSLAGDTQTVNAVVAQKTNAQVIAELKNEIQKAFVQYRENVRIFVKREGPYAFANLYYGRFQQDNPGVEYKGIKKLLEEVVYGTQPNNPDGLRASLQNVENQIRGQNVLAALGSRSKLATAWLNTYNQWVNARIQKTLAEAVFGGAGELKRSFLDPAGILAEQVATFGDVISTLADIYSASGSRMESFDAFSASADSATEVNIAAVTGSTSAYSRLKHEADEKVSNAQTKEFRDALVDSFFAKPAEWLDVPEGIATKDNGSNQAHLINPDRPVRARELFDDFASSQIDLTTIDTSIEKLFTEEAASGHSYAVTAASIINNLVAKSSLRFNGQTETQGTNRYIKYPAVLDKNAGEAPQIKAALLTACQQAGIPATSVYPSYDSDSILLYQQATCIEIYRCAQLKDWERDYELAIANQAECLTIHGKSPDTEKVIGIDGFVKYVEHTPWKDYPSIVQRDDPTKRGADGTISREGILRMEERKLIDKAKEYGVLYSEQTLNNTWVVKRVFFDKSIDWNFAITGVMPDMATGLMPTGRKLAESVAAQNGRNIADISRIVRLDYAGIFSLEAPDEETAWERAYRVLRAHHPMFCEVRHSCKLMAPWYDVIMQRNNQLLQSKRPGMLIHLFRGLIVSKTPEGAWIWNKADGTQMMIANYTPVMLDFILPKDRYQIENGLLAYNLYAKVNQMMPGDELVSEYKRAKAQCNAWMQSGDIARLTEGKNLAEFVEAERQALLAKGANDGKQPLQAAFVSAMQPFGFTENELKNVEQFYALTTQWAQLP